MYNLVRRHSMGKWGSAIFTFLQKILDGLNINLNETICLTVVRACGSMNKSILSWKAAEMNRVSLPVMTLLGIPCYSKINFRWAVVVFDCISFSFRIRGNLLIIKYAELFPQNKSDPRVCHGLCGMSCGSKCSLTFLFWCRWHGAHSFTICSMSELMLAHNNDPLALSLHLSAPLLPIV